MSSSSGTSDGTIYDEKTNEPLPRSFDPKLSDLHWRLDSKDLVFADHAKRVCRFRIIHPNRNTVEIDWSSIVIHIDGASRGNGYQNARAGWGVFVGDNSPHNARGTIPPHFQQTNNIAEIEALSQALDIIQEIVIDARDYAVRRIYILTDSEYVVKCLTLWWAKWMANGGINAAGKPVAHLEKLREIQDRMDNMERAGVVQRRIKLCHIRRERNTRADALANLALDESQVPGVHSGYASIGFLM